MIARQVEFQLILEVEEGDDLKPGDVITVDIPEDDIWDTEVIEK